MKSLIKTIVFVLFLFSIFQLLPSSIEAAVPHLINYQGRLTDTSGKPLEGSYAVTFRIYDAETAGTMLWEETHTGLVIQKGIFSVMLGSVTSLDGLPFNKQYYLEIKAGSEVMSPRQIIASAAYAIAGVPSGVIVMWSGSLSNIPKGWVLCDGTNGTPDLRDRFIVGARQDDGGVAKTNITGSFTTSGGSTSISIANLPSHNHGVGTLTVGSESGHTHSIARANINTGDGGGGAGNFDGFAPEAPMTSGPGSPHTHTLSGSTGASGSGVPYSQPYYALAYIMKL